MAYQDSFPPESLRSIWRPSWYNRQHDYLCHTRMDCLSSQTYIYKGNSKNNILFYYYLQSCLLLLQETADHIFTSRGAWSEVTIILPDSCVQLNRGRSKFLDLLRNSELSFEVGLEEYDRTLLIQPIIVWLFAWSPQNVMWSWFGIISRRFSSFSPGRSFHQFLVFVGKKNSSLVARTKSFGIIILSGYS